MLLALPINFKNASLMIVLRDILSVKKIIRVGHCKITMSAKCKSFIALIRKTSFSYFKKISSLFHGQFLLSLYMSDIKYTSCTARHMGEKLSDFSHVPNIKGLLIK